MARHESFLELTIHWHTISPLTQALANNVSRYPYNSLAQSAAENRLACNYIPIVAGPSG